MLKHYVFGLATLLLLAGCATPHVVQSVRATDGNLSCTQLEIEMAEADRFRSDAQKEKGMTGTNVAAVLLFWPAMIGTYANANEAIAAADARKVGLMGHYNQKKCAEAPLSPVAATATPLTAERKLVEIKDMLEKKLISQNEYDEKRKKILAGI